MSNAAIDNQVLERIHEPSATPPCLQIINVNNSGTFDVVCHCGSKSFESFYVVFNYIQPDCQPVSHTIWFSLETAIPTSGPSPTPGDPWTPSPTPVSGTSTPVSPTNTPSGGGTLEPTPTPTPTPTDCPTIVPEEKTLNINHVYQGNKPWCWAACMSMVLGYYDDYKPMCEVFNLFNTCYLPSPTPYPSGTPMIIDCCEYPFSISCKNGPTWTFEDNFYRQCLGYNCSDWMNNQFPLYNNTSDCIVCEIQAGRPVTAGFYVGGTKGHDVLIIGYDYSDCEDPTIIIHDPALSSGATEVSFDEFAGYRGYFLHSFLYKIFP